MSPAQRSLQINQSFFVFFFFLSFNIIICHSLTASKDFCLRTTMLDEQPARVVYIQPPLSTTRKFYPSPKYISVRNNQVLPRPIFTCIDEVYASPTGSQVSSSVETTVTATSSSQVLKGQDESGESAPKWQKWIIIIIFTVIIICVVVIIVLLSVFLTRWCGWMNQYMVVWCIQTDDRHPHDVRDWLIRHPSCHWY